MTTTETLTISPITPFIGGTVTGVDLREADATLTERLRRELAERSLLVFPAQHLNPSELLRFIKGFGELDHGIVRTNNHLEEEPEVLVLETTSAGSAGKWHTDHSFTPKPPMAACLQAMVLPSVGGDTGFASMFAAYDALSPVMKELLDGLTATYSTEPITRRFEIENRNVTEESKKINLKSVHPIVRTHPETGRKSLFYSGETCVRINELTEEESDAILGFLREHTKQPIFQCRHKWEVGTIALWDERSTLHCAVGDANERRVMWRLMLQGDEPR